MWCQPRENGQDTLRTFIVLFDDPDQGVAVFTDEREARAYYLKASTNWNCTLFGAMPLKAEGK